MTWHRRNKCFIRLHKINYFLLQLLSTFSHLIHLWVWYWLRMNNTALVIWRMSPRATLLLSDVLSDVAVCTWCYNATQLSRPMSPLVTRCHLFAVFFIWVLRAFFRPFKVFLWTLDFCHFQSSPSTWPFSKKRVWFFYVCLFRVKFELYTVCTIIRQVSVLTISSF